MTSPDSVEHHEDGITHYIKRILDYDENDQVVGIEFLNVSLRTPEKELASLQFQTA